LEENLIECLAVLVGLGITASVCQSAGWVTAFHPDRNISQTVRWIAMKLGIDRQSLSTEEEFDWLVSPLFFVPPWCWVLGKCLDIYWRFPDIFFCAIMRLKVQLLHYVSFSWSFYPKRLTIMWHSYTVDTDTGSNSGLSVLLKDTSTRAGIEPPTPPIEGQTGYPPTHSRPMNVCLSLCVSWDELATCPGDPAFAQCQLGSAPCAPNEDKRDG